MSEELSTEDVARMWGIRFSDLRRICNMSDRDFHEWLHTTPEGQQYLEDDHA